MVRDGVLQMTNEPPKGLRANMSNSYHGFSDETMAKTDKPDAWRKLLYAMCFFHAVIQERRKFGPLGWNILYEFNDSDKEVNVMQLEELLDQNEEIPYRVIRILAGNVNYGGRVTDDLDRRTLMIGLDDFVCEDVLSDSYAFSPSGLYLSPPDNEYDGYVDFLKALPINADPEVFGLHKNADITCAQNETYAILGTLLSLQPKVAGGTGMSREEVLDEAAADILDRIPAEINFERVCRRCPVQYEESMNTVLQQEVIRYNGLLPSMNAGLLELRKALKGTIVMSEGLERMGDAMFANQVPAAFEKLAYPSLKPLASWVSDLARRIAFLTDWIDNGAVLCGRVHCCWTSVFKASTTLVPCRS